MQGMIKATMNAEAKEGEDPEDVAELTGEDAFPSMVMEQEVTEDPDPEGETGPSAQDWPDDKMPTDYEAQCYMERYKDLGHILGGFDLTKAKMHWMEKGRYEGRWLAPCGLGESNPFTREEAHCMADRYSMNQNLVAKANEGPRALMKSYQKWGRKFGFNRFCAPRITFW